MSIDKKNTILDKELNEWRLKERHWALPFLGVFALLLILAVWALCLQNDKDNTDGVGGKGQGFIQGDGRGHGQGGQGDGDATGKGDGSQPGDKPDSRDNPTEQPSSPDKKTAPPSDSGNKDPSGGNSADKNQKNPNNEPKRYGVQLPDSDQKPSPPSDKRSGNNSGGSDFYGSQVKSSGKILFLVDTSGSMANNMGKLKNELRKAVFSGTAPNPKTYQRGGGFVLVEFNSSVKRYPGKKLYRYRSKTSMQEAEQAINGLVPGGNTCMQQAWQLVLQIVIEENITTVYFLSDGFSTDAFTAEWLQAELGKNPKTKTLRVNCFSIGVSNNELKKVANATGGKYYQL